MRCELKSKTKVPIRTTHTAELRCDDLTLTLTDWKQHARNDGGVRDLAGDKRKGLERRDLCLHQLAKPLGCDCRQLFWIVVFEEA